MLKLDGREYKLQTPGNIATDMVEYINSYCAENNIVNLQGEPVNITPVFANPLYALIYGLSYMLSILQRILYNIACGFSIPNSSDTELLNLATLAAVRRKPAKYTTIRCTVINNGSGTLNITSANTWSTAVDNTLVTFKPSWDVSVPSGESSLLVLESTITGSFPVENTAVIQLSGLSESTYLIMHDKAITGGPEETIGELRERLQHRAKASSRIDRVIEALEELETVNKCNFFFNYSSAEPLVINGITIPPRKGLLLIQGSNSRIAEVFYTYLSCETVQAGIPDREGVSVFTTKSGQQIPVYFITPIQRPVYVRIHIKSGSLTTEDRERLRQVAAMATQNLNINEELTSSFVTNKIHTLLPEITFEGLEFSLSEDADFSYRVECPTQDSLLVVSYNNITIVEE